MTERAGRLSVGFWILSFFRISSFALRNSTSGLPRGLARTEHFLFAWTRPGDRLLASTVFHHANTNHEIQSPGLSENHGPGIGRARIGDRSRLQRPEAESFLRRTFKDSARYSHLQSRQRLGSCHHPQELPACRVRTSRIANHPCPRRRSHVEQGAARGSEAAVSGFKRRVDGTRQRV